MSNLGSAMAGAGIHCVVEKKEKKMTLKVISKNNEVKHA